MRRTSVKAFLISLALLIVGVACMSAAESHYMPSNPIRRIGGDFGRAWNHWDYVWTASILLSAAFAVVGFMFLNKDD